jgi:ParB family protein of integrating conjugative element (PFGI_1 class)
MPSKTPETLTAVQRAQLLKLQSNGKSVEAGTSPTSTDMSASTTKPRTPSKQEQEAVLKGRSTLPPIGGPRSATADIDPHKDADMSFLVLPISEIEPYEHNPRTSPNPNYEQIKASIRADGITNTLTVTRRDKHGKYTTYGGGNTRLKIAKELYAEGDRRFATLQVIFKDWPGDAQVITAHLVENENRGDITFWEKAQGVKQFQIQFEQEGGKPLTAGELNRELKTRGLNYGIKTLQNFAFAVEHLPAIGPWLSARAVNETLRPQAAFLQELGVKFNQAQPMRQRLLAVMQGEAESLRNLATKNEGLEPEDRIAVELDIPLLVESLRITAAEVLNVDPSQLAAMQAALNQHPGINADALRRSVVSDLASPAAVVAPALGGSVALAPEPDTPASRPQEVAQRGPVPPRQAPLAGMLAGVPPAMPPRSTAQAPVLSDPDADLTDSIKRCLEDLNEVAFLNDVVLDVPVAPFGFLLDFPARGFGFVDEKQIDPAIAELRARLWRVLVSISGQCDQRVTRLLRGVDAWHWGQAAQQGPEAFQRICADRANLRFDVNSSSFWWDMTDLARVLSEPTTGYGLIKLLGAMEQVRLNLGERIPEGYVPLFTKDMSQQE